MGGDNARAKSSGRDRSRRRTNYEVFGYGGAVPLRRIAGTAKQGLGVVVPGVSSRTCLGLLRNARNRRHGGCWAYAGWTGGWAWMAGGNPEKRMRLERNGYAKRCLVMMYERDGQSYWFWGLVEGRRGWGVRSCPKKSNSSRPGSLR